MTVNFGQVRFFILLGELLGFFAVLFNAWSAGDEMRPADYRFYPMDFPSPLETDSGDRWYDCLCGLAKRSQKFLENWEKTQKKLCKRTENTCKLGVYYCIIILKIGELYPQKRERFFGRKK